MPTIAYSLFQNKWMWTLFGRRSGFRSDGRSKSAMEPKKPKERNKRGNKNPERWCGEKNGMMVHVLQCSLVFNQFVSELNIGGGIFSNFIK